MRALFNPVGSFVESRPSNSSESSQTGIVRGIALEWQTGYDALRLSLRAWVSLGRLEPGDEVVVPANSFVASALAVTDAGLLVRLADVDPASPNVSYATVAAAMTPRTRVVMPVHLYGQLAEIESIRELCRERGMHCCSRTPRRRMARGVERRAREVSDTRAHSASIRRRISGRWVIRAASSPPIQYWPNA